MTRSSTRVRGLRRPGGRRRQARLVLEALIALLSVELRVRSTPVPVLCRQMGVTFAGFTSPRQTAGPLSYDIAEVWWGLECGLRWWPWARGRMCLRRSLALGHLLRHMGPALTIDVVSSRPFSAHATLVVRGYQLDMGSTGEPVIGLGAR